MSEAIILAGGLGTRLRSVVSDVPKPMAPIAGKPFLEYLLRYWRKQGVSHFVLTVCHMAEVIEAHFGSEFEGASISYSVEKTPLGTGGAILQARASLKQNAPFLVINGDTFFEVPLASLQRFHQDKSAQVSIALARVKENTRYSGLDLQPDGRLLSFQAQGKSAHLWINGGVYLCSRSDWGAVRQVSLENGLFSELIGRGDRVYGFPCEGRFIDIGIPEDYRAAETFVSSL